MLVRNEHVREDPVRTFATACDRAQKHTSNSLHGVITTHLPSVMSTPTLILETQFETRLDGVQATAASLVDGPQRPNRGHSESERQSTSGGSEKASPLPGAQQTDKKGRKGKPARVVRPTTYTYKHCIIASTHKAKDCLFANHAAEISVAP